MILNLQCDACGESADYTIDDSAEDIPLAMPCEHCASIIYIHQESFIIQKLKHTENASQVLKNGTIVIIDNSDHVWHNEIGLVCDHKPKFYRLEVLGKKIWVPEEWVKENVTDNAD